MFYPWGFLIKDLKTKREIFKGFVDLDCIHYMTSQQIPILLHSKHSLRSIPTNSNLVAFQATKVSSTIWYARLGHPNSRILQLLLTCLPTLNKQVTFYQSWIIGKLKKFPFASWCKPLDHVGKHPTRKDIKFLESQVNQVW